MAEKQQEDILLEVKDYIERERTTQFFKKHGQSLGYLAVGIIVVFAGYEIWKSHDTETRQALGDKFVAEVTSSKATIETKDFANQAGYHQLAQMAFAKRLVDSKKPEEAIKEYQKLWDNPKTDKAIAKLAKVKAAIIMIDGNNAETPTWLNSSDDKIFDSEFNELVAIHSLENGNDEKAEKVFQSLSDNKLTTATVKNRADAYLSEIKNN